MHEGRNKDKCPKCRCKKIERFDHYVEYPQQYTSFFCENCGFLVGLVDNSPYVSCYEFEDFIIDF